MLRVGPMPPIVNVFFLVLIVSVVFALTLLPAIRRGMARSGGLLVRAQVKSIRPTATYDEHHRPYHEAVLEIALPGRAPYEVTVKQVLPWLSGPGSSLRELQVRAHPKFPRSVFIVGPMPLTDRSAGGVSQ